MSKNRFSEIEREAFYNAILHLDSEAEIVICDKETDSLSYTSLLESEENITGRPTDEELTRALIILNLVNNYNYDISKIKIEDRFHTGGRSGVKARAVETDIVIKNDDDIIEIIIEVKKIHDFGGTDDQAINKQLFRPFNNIVKYNSAKYLFHVSCDVPIDKEHFPLNCVGIDTSISSTYKDWSKQGKTPHFLDFIQSGEEPEIQEVFVKLSGKEENIKSGFKDLDNNFGVDILRRKWRIIWDYIWGGTLEDNKKFENFNKVLLAKIYDERKTKLGTAYSFQRKFKGKEPQKEGELASDVDLLYRKAFREYLSKDKNIELKDIKGIDFKEFPHHLVAKCVEIFQPLSFQKNRYKNVDILGEFYEMVLREAFKQTKGLFLTHPNIVLFILSALDIHELIEEKLRHPDEDNRYRMPFVIDPSCGTGTFLIHYMKYAQKFINENKDTVSGGDEDVKDFIDRYVLDKNAYKWVIDYVYGIDNEQVLATACQINLILHGDGSTNIYSADGLADFSTYSALSITGANNLLSSNLKQPSGFYSKKGLSKFDVIISNPPFNVNINKGRVQNNFEIQGKSEAYFLERWYQLLKPKGRIGVVLPESFFSVEDDVKGRLFLYKHFDIKSIVALPNHAFQPHTTTSTSLLFASKKSKEDEEKFSQLWGQFEGEFNTKYSSFKSQLSVKKTDLKFDKEDREEDDSISTYIKNNEAYLDNSFGKAFIVLPYFDDDYIFSIDNYSKIKKRILDAVTAVKDRWILNKVTNELDCRFVNFSIDEIGYKAGKKGAKDKPNELMTILDQNDEKIYNLKYAHSWSRIDADDMETVLGQLKDLEIWQS